MTRTTEAAHAKNAGRRRRGVGHYVKSTIATIVVVAILAGAGFVALSLARGTWMVTPVLSGSMRPGFSVGGVVVSQRVPLKDIAVRDVIVFQNPILRTEQMIHRIIKLTRLPGGAIKIKTQGDATPIPDPWTVEIRTRDVYRIRWSLPLLGYVAVAYQNHKGILLAVAGVLLLLVAAGTWFRSESKKKVAEQGDAPVPVGAEGAEGGSVRPAPLFAEGAPSTFEYTVRQAQLATAAPTGGTKVLR